YSIVMSPPASATTTFTLTLSPDVTGTLTSGTASTVNLASLGQSATLNFTLGSVQTIALYFNSLSVTPAGANFTVSLLGPSGSLINTGTFTTSNLTINAPNLAAGTYTVLLVPTVPATGSFQATLEPGVSATVPVNGSSNNYSTPVPGQYVYLSFSGSVGQNLSMALTSVATTPTGASL